MNRARRADEQGEGQRLHHRRDARVLEEGGDEGRAEEGDGRVDQRGQVGDPEGDMRGCGDVLLAVDERGAEAELAQELQRFQGQERGLGNAEIGRHEQLEQDDFGEKREDARGHR